MGYEALIWCLYAVIGWVLVRWGWLRVVRRRPKAGTVVLVTGGCGGIGRELVLKFASEHCDIVVWDRMWDRNLHSSLALIAEVETRGRRCICLECDVSNEDDVASATQNTLSTVDSVDVLICNAGVAQKQRFLNLTPSQFRATFETNLFGCANTIRSFLTSPRPPRQVVVLSSVLAFGMVSGLSEYSASKHALHAFITTLRIEARETGMNVEFIEICPWHVKTKLFEGWGVRWGLLPPLSPQYVAKSVFDAICTRQSLVVLPWYHWYFFSLLQHLPTSLHDRMVLFLVPSDPKKLS